MVAKGIKTSIWTFTGIENLQSLESFHLTFDATDALHSEKAKLTPATVYFPHKYPPSITNVLPVMKALSSLAR